MIRAVANAAVLVLLAGCAAPTTNTVQTGADTFEVMGYSGTYILVETGPQRIPAEQKASAYCNDMDQEVDVVNADSRRMMTTHGYYTEVTYEFRCIEPRPATVELRAPNQG